MCIPWRWDLGGKSPCCEGTEVLVQCPETVLSSQPRISIYRCPAAAPDYPHLCTTATQTRRPFLFWNITSCIHCMELRNYSHIKIKVSPQLEHEADPHGHTHPKTCWKKKDIFKHLGNDPRLIKHTNFVFVLDLRMLGWQRRFISCTSLSMLALLLGSVFIFRAITCPVILCWTWDTQRSFVE